MRLAPQLAIPCITPANALIVDRRAPQIQARPGSQQRETGMFPAGDGGADFVESEPEVRAGDGDEVVGVSDLE